MTNKSRAFRIGKAFGKKGVLGKASLETPEAVGVTEIADSAEALGTANTGVSKFSSNDKKLFVYNGTAWDKVLSGTDGPPVWDSGGSAVTVPKALSQNYNFNTFLSTLDSQRITLSVSASDPDGFPIVYSSDQHPASNNLIDSVTQTSSGVFRVTPNIMSGESNANDTVSFRILASDGARVATGSTVFSISYSKFSIFKKGAASTGFWGDTYGTNYNYGSDGQSGIGDEITDDGTTQILNKFGEYWLLPTANFTADLKIWGAAGSTSSDGVAGSGDDHDAGNIFSGFGGYTYARMSFVKDQYYTIIVGQGGAFGTGNGNSHGPPASFGGGGSAGRANTGGHNHGKGAGGGLSGIFLGKEFADVDAVHSASLLIAGGGGGGYGQVGGGGSGGGTTGTGSSGSRGGGGASQSAGGSAGSGSYSSGGKQAGGKILGGSTSRTGRYTPGGGGGGYYGGGTGGPNNYAGGPGGGGSGYVKSDASITNSGMNTALASTVAGPSPGRDEAEWGDEAGVGNYDHASSTANPYVGGGDDETDIGGWRRVNPGRFAIIPV